MDIDVRRIDTKDALPFILFKHYARRKPLITYVFGLFIDNKLVGICSYGSPSSPQICRGPFGRDYAHRVIELNRLCIESDVKNAASMLVGRSLKMLPRNTIVVSYADGAMGHVGYIYQATNFIYTGAHASHDSEYIVNGKKTHPRTLVAEGITNPKQWARENNIEMVAPKKKHRYIFLCGKKKDHKELMLHLRYKIENYPKGETRRYDTSEVVTKTENKSQAELF